MSKENTTIYVILGLLTHEDLTGYDLKKRIDKAINNFWDVGYGQIYPTLKTLEKDGLVTKRISSEGKGPDRIIYSITESGRKKLQQWLFTPEEKEYVKYEILLKLFFGSLIPTQENIKRILEFRGKYSEKLHTIDMFKKRLSEILLESEDHYYYYLTVLFGEHLYKAYLNWADEAVKILQNLNKEI